MPTAKKSPARKAATTTSSAKKATAKKTANLTPKQVPAKVPAWSTIHIFGYGESQIIGSKANGKVPNAQLKLLQPLFASLSKKQQKGTKVSLENTHALNIFNGAFVDYRPRGMDNNGQRFDWVDVDAKAVEKLADELMSRAPKEQKGGFMKKLLERRDFKSVTHQMDRQKKRPDDVKR